MMKLKRMLSAILAVVLVFSMMPAGLSFEAKAADVQQADVADTESKLWCYTDTDFESLSGDEKLEYTMNGGSEFVTDRDGDQAIKLVNGAYVIWNYNQIWKLGQNTMYEFDVYTPVVGVFHFKLTSETGKQFFPVTLRSSAHLRPKHAETQEKLLAHETIHIAVGVNSAANTYSVWFNGTQVANNARIAESNGTAIPNFGIPSSFRMEMTGDEGNAGANYVVDNLKIYDGTSPDDYAKTYPADAQVEDESWLEEWFGKQSPALDYATDALAVINAANATMVNMDTLFVYQNGQKRQATESEVAAILADTNGKVVTKNDYGLVIISNAALTLTDKQMDSLQDYMVYTRPAAQTLKELFNSTQGNEHPRVILNQDKIDRILADYQTNPTVKKWADAVITKANSMIKSAHVTMDNGAPGRTIRDRGMYLSMAYLLTKDTKYKDYLWIELETAGNFEHWSHLSSLLTTSDYTVGFSVAYDWLYNDWTEEQRTFLEEAIYDHALFRHHRYMYGIGPGLGTFITSETNRNAVCNGGMGLASIALFDVYPDKCADILEKAYHMLEYMLGEFAPDGANIEGPAYWEYEMRYLVPFMASTELTFGSDFHIYDTPRLRQNC